MDLLNVDGKKEMLLDIHPSTRVNTVPFTDLKRSEEMSFEEGRGENELCLVNIINEIAKYKFPVEKKFLL